MLRTTGENASANSISFQLIGDGTTKSRVIPLSEFPFNFAPGKVPLLVEANAPANDDIDPPTVISTCTVTEGVSGLDLTLELVDPLPAGTILEGPLQQININMAW